MRASLSLFAVALVALTSVATATPVANDSSDLIAERSAALADVDAMVARDEDVMLESRRKHHKKARKHKKHKKHTSAKKGGNGVATWYTGSQMNAPACGGGTPSDNDMVGAVSQNSPFKCHDRVTLSRGSKKVTVKVVDFCESCSPTHVDLSKAAFKKLASLGEGELHGLNWSMN